jgi:hypothetical protein
VGKRIVFGTLVVVLLLLLSSASAIAAPGGQGNDGTPPGQAKKSETGQADNGQGKSHAPQNASRGMNRPGAPGSWKSHGHTPAAVSYPQGHSPSDPDFTGNGGIDKPGQSGGFSADRDGNNGCGNDDDREDDNNGWCGKKPHEVTPPETPPTVVPPVTPPVTPPETRPRVRVLGGPILPRTGVDAFDLSYLGIAVMTAGIVLRRRADSPRARAHR